jgi:hypothetical protein
MMAGDVMGVIGRSQISKLRVNLATDIRGVGATGVEAAGGWWSGWIGHIAF